MSDDCDSLVEIRGVDDVENVALENIWIANQPVGTLIENMKGDIRDLQSRLAEAEADAQQAQQTATNALGVAKATDNGIRADGSPSKVDIARMTARNELVKRGLLDRSSTAGGGVTVGEVQDMCRPEHEMAYQTVKDAFGNLVEQWRSLQVGENEAGRRTLYAETTQMSKELTGVVEEDLGRDDLTKRLISRRGGEGGE